MKAILTFALKAPISFTEENISEIERLKFTPCKENDLSSTGFSETVAGDFVSDISGNTVLVVTTQKKTPNKAEVKAKLKVRALSFEEKFGNKPNKDDLESMQGEIIRSLLPNIYPDEPKHSTVVFTKDFLLIEAASYLKAEDTVALLRNILGSLPAIPLQTVDNVEDTLAEFITKPNSTDFMLGTKAVLDIPEPKGKAAFSNGEVSESKAASLVKAGAFVDSVQLGFEEMTFTLKSDLAISGIKFSKELTSEVDKKDAYGSFLLQLNEIELMVTELVDTFGGLRVE